MFRERRVTFRDRQDAGRLLGERLLHLRGGHNVVLGLPRGGVVVAAEIAAALGAPLDVLVVRKIGAPEQPELAIGAVTDGERPQTILNDQVIHAVGATREYIEQESQRQLAEVRRRQALYRDGRAAVRLEGRCVIVADDGIATGATVRAGIKALRQLGPSRIVLAVPVAPPDTAAALSQEVDELVCLHTPRNFTAVGACYGDFRQTTDEQVVAILEEASP